MKKYFLILPVVLFLFSVSIFAQTSNPTPTPAPDDEDVVRISTNLIQLDATVTDKKGNVVTDLKPEDFEIYEDGQKQDITNLSFVSGSVINQLTEAKQASNSGGKFSAPAPIVKLKPEQVRWTYALVVDDLGLSFSNMSYVKDSLKKFVNEQMQEGDLVAILRVSGGLGALQSFTSDKRQLMAAIGKIRWNGSGRVGVNSFEPLGTTLKENLSGASKPDGTFTQVMGTEEDKKAAKRFESDRQSNNTIGTIGAMNYIIRGMRDLPGRKSLTLFFGSNVSESGV